MDEVVNFFIRQPLTWEFWLLLVLGLTVIWIVFFVSSILKKKNKTLLPCQGGKEGDFDEINKLIVDLSDLDPARDDYYTYSQNIFREPVSYTHMTMPKQPER